MSNQVSDFSCVHVGIAIALSGERQIRNKEGRREIGRKEGVINVK